MTHSSFTDKSNLYAIVGVSEDASKWGRKIYEKLKESGFKTVPVNPKYSKIGEEKCYSSLSEISPKPDVVITAVPPKITQNVVKKANSLGIKRIWMQPGSESPNAIKYCEDNALDCIHHSCFVVDGMRSGF